MKNLKSLLSQLVKLDSKDLTLFLTFTPYQVEVLAKLTQKRNLSAKDLLKSKLKLSKSTFNQTPPFLYTKVIPVSFSKLFY